MKQLISVIIPCYNVEKYVTECLDSVVNQTIGIEHMEVIVIDDASTDQTLDCIMNYQQQYPHNIRVVALSENGGQANARNTGIEMATTDYLIFIDSDDWIEPDMCEKMLKAATEHMCDMIQCARIEHIEGLEPCYISVDTPIEYCEINSVNKRKEFYRQRSLGKLMGCTLYKTAWINRESIRFRKFVKYEDNYWGGLVKYSVGSYGCIPDFLYHYRVLTVSNSHARNDERHFVRLDVELEKLKYYCEKGLFETYYEEIREEFLESFYINTLHIICCQFDEIPLERIHMMQEIVKQIYPDYLEFVKKSIRFINPVLTVAFDFPETVWKRYKDIYLAWCQEGKEQELAQFYHNMRNALKI